jgi:hypothetical protein
MRNLYEPYLPRRINTRSLLPIGNGFSFVADGRILRDRRTTVGRCLATLVLQIHSSDPIPYINCSFVFRNCQLLTVVILGLKSSNVILNAVLRQNEEYPQRSKLSQLRPVSERKTCCGFYMSQPLECRLWDRNVGE